MRWVSLILLFLVVAVLKAWADDALRVGKAVAGPFDFVPFDVGLAKGFFKAHGIDATEIDFDGSAKLQQGLGADAIDVGLGSGPGLRLRRQGQHRSRYRRVRRAAQQPGADRASERARASMFSKGKNYRHLDGPAR